MLFVFFYLLSADIFNMNLYVVVFGGSEEGREAVQRKEHGCHILGREGVIVVEVEKGQDGTRNGQVDGQEQPELTEAEVHKRNQVAGQVLNYTFAIFLEANTIHKLTNCTFGDLICEFVIAYLVIYSTFLIFNCTFGILFYICVL
jgi:hypothetical protein